MFRPLSTDELQKYTEQRGEALKSNLSSLGSSATLEQVQTAYQQANQQALQSIGAESVRTPSTRTGSTGAGGAAPSTSSAGFESGGIAAGGGGGLGSNRLATARGGIGASFKAGATGLGSVSKLRSVSSAPVSGAANRLRVSAPKVRKPGVRAGSIGRSKGKAIPRLGSGKLRNRLTTHRLRA